MIAAGPQDGFEVSGCNVECLGCLGVDAATHVIGVAESTGKQLFAGPRASGEMYSCSARVPIGERVILRASNSPTFEFDHWRLFGPPHTGDYCPCHDSRDPVCRITVTPDLPGRHTRAYCGAVWRPRGAAVQAAAPICGEDPSRFVTADGALILSGSQSVTLGAGPHRFTRVCVRDQARITLCARETAIEISGDATSTIAGRGIGPVGTQRADVAISATGTGTLAIMFDNLAAPIKATFEAPRVGNVYIGLTGKTGLEIAGGPLQHVHYSAGWGDSSAFPACAEAPARAAY
jgi:hypothetical protein